nr:hypothetical protein Iba_chr07bCG9620 [Ipomoea batatas]
MGPYQARLETLESRPQANDESQGGIKRDERHKTEPKPQLLKRSSRRKACLRILRVLSERMSDLGAPYTRKGKWEVPASTWAWLKLTDPHLLKVESEQITPALPWGVSPVQVRSQPISMAIPLAHEPPALPIEAPQDSTEQHSTASQTPHSTSSDDFVSSPVVVVPPAQPDPPLDDSDNGPAGEEVALFPDTYHLSNVNPVGGFAATIT